MHFTKQIVFLIIKINNTYSIKRNIETLPSNTGRRDFIKKAGAGMIGVAGAGLLNLPEVSGEKKVKEW